MLTIQEARSPNQGAGSTPKSGCWEHSQVRVLGALPSQGAGSPNQGAGAHPNQGAGSTSKIVEGRP